MLSRRRFLQASAAAASTPKEAVAAIFHQPQIPDEPTSWTAAIRQRLALRGGATRTNEVDDGLSRVQSGGSNNADLQNYRTDNEAMLDEMGPMDYPDIGNELPEIPMETYWRFQQAGQRLVDDHNLPFGKFFVVDPVNQILGFMDRESDGTFAINNAYPVSTAAKGLGNVNGSGKTPTGAFRLGRPVGIGNEFGYVYTPEMWGRVVADLSTNVGKALMTTRLIPIIGLEGHNRNTQSRDIVAHGTNREHRLGSAASGGCVRLDNGVSVAVSAITIGNLREGGDGPLLEIIDPKSKIYRVPRGHRKGMYDMRPNPEHPRPWSNGPE